MNTMIRRRTQLSVVAATALAIVAVAAVMLLAGGSSAQVTAATLAPDSYSVNPWPQQTDPTPTPTPTPRHATPEPCAGEAGNTNQTADVVSVGHVALFDVYWDDSEGELANNPCPPTVVHVPAGEDADLNPIPARDDRTASNINIDETIIHIPNSAKVDLSASDTPYPQDEYPGVWNADNEENINGSGTGDGIVWVLPACPDGALTDSLCIGVSADLLDPEDWGKYQDGVTAPGPVEFLIDHAHQHDVGEQGGRYVLAYHVTGDGTSENAVRWDTSDADKNVIPVAPGEYEYPIWFFTRAGRYEFQVHVKGYPELNRSGGLTAVSTDDSVTSDVREYFFHVGLMADLSIDVTAEPADSSDATLDPGDNVTITVTASSAGPDEATGTRVDVSLPTGLTYSSHTASTGTYDSSTGAWSIGNLAETDDDNDDTADNSPTLIITATVDNGTRGQEQTVTANIYATEQLDSASVLELDPWTADNTDGVKVTPHSIPNANPRFHMAFTVAENAPTDTKVGTEIAVKEPNSGDALHLSLSGRHAEYFTVENVQGAAQVKVSSSAILDLDTTSAEIDLELSVRDNKDRHGNSNTTVDDTIPVQITIEDDPNGFDITFSATEPTPATGDRTATFTVTASNLPTDITAANLLGIQVGVTHGIHLDVLHLSGTWTEPQDGTATFTWSTTRPAGSGEYQYSIDVWYDTTQNGTRGASAVAPPITVTW